MRNLSKIIVLRDKNRPLYLPLKIEKNGNSLNKFFFILKFMEKYLLNKLIFMFSKNELFISCEQCLPSVYRYKRLGIRRQIIRHEIQVNF